MLGAELPRIQKNGRPGPRGTKNVNSSGYILADEASDLAHILQFYCRPP